MIARSTPLLAPALSPRGRGERGLVALGLLVLLSCGVKGPPRPPEPRPAVPGPQAPAGPAPSKPAEPAR